MTWMDGLRTDPLPKDPSGTYVIEGGRDHRLWVVSHPYVFQLGSGPGIPNDERAEELIGPWRYVSVPLPSDVLYGQGNHALPTTRRWTDNA